MGHRSKGPAAVASQMGVLCSLPNHAVAYPFSLRIWPDGGRVLLDERVVAGETRWLLDDDAGVHRVMVAPGDERRAASASIARSS